MNETESRELDAWIAENVMEYHRGHPGGCKTEYWQPPPCKFGVIPVEKLPKFTTDPAAAMEVLKKCVDKVSREDCGDFIKIKKYDGEWFLKTFLNQKPIIAETLELAICLFAKQLFKEAK